MAEFDSIRQLPFSIEAEQAVLGAVVCDPGSFDMLAELKASDFYLEQHAAIFAAIAKMASESRTVDTITLIDTLTKLGTYTEGDAAKYIKLLVDISIGATNIREYVNIIKEKALLRSLIDISRDVSEKAYTEPENPELLLDFAQQRFYDLTKDSFKTDFDHISDVIKNSYETLQRIQNDPDSMKGTQTGFSGIDTLLVGMGPGDLVIIGGRPGMGKTSIGINMAVNVAKQTGKDVAIFSLEMTSEQLVNRMLSSEALIDNNDMRRGNIKADGWTRLAEAASVLGSTNIYIDDSSMSTVMSMRTKLRRLKNPGLVVIDYLQLMQADMKSNGKAHENRVQEVGSITRGLKLMAKDIGVPILLCAQLARGPEGRQDKMPMLSDLRESGSIEQDADICMFLYRDDYYNNNEEEDKKQDSYTAKCSIAKNRHGATGIVDLAWHGRFFKFVSIDNKH